ncbi:hypothetical protein RHMOL_Rhmol08G0161000 [Rhododendron molle]|uniref:Uncharacterized protein n=1 Tax=Rhododendron molle TaxID=49168 RepID=A0ACC0MQ19_RHOML|nr:hypothetical protein RHMOL_Rhmol08G0161000 [Rhododendron molle]
MLEIVGVTSTELTFNAAFAFIESENEDNYTWVLDKLKGIMDVDALPNVIVTDRELALMNAIRSVFPDARNLLCRFHIGKNVLAKCMKMFDDKMWEEFSCSWGLVVLSASAEQYEERLRALKRDFKMVPAALEYLEKNWLEPYKERAESAHATLKLQLQHSQCNFDSIWEKIHRLILLQETEVRGSFEKSLTCMQHDFRIPLFDSLRGVVSKNAMTFVLVASHQVQWLVESNSACGCALRKTNGLPCAHEIAPYKMGNIPIPLDLIHDHWKRLSLLLPQVDVSLGETVKADFEIFYNRFMNESHAGQLHLPSKLKEVFHLECTTLLEPKQKVKTRGRPSTKEKNAKKVKNATKLWHSTHRDPSKFEHVLASLENGNPKAVKMTPRRNPEAQLVAPQASLQSVKDVNDKPRCNPKVQAVAPQASLQSVEGCKRETTLQSNGPTRCTTSLPVDDVKRKSQRNSRAKAKAAHASTSDFINQFPKAIRPYIESVKDVEFDGNCGFQTISAFMKEDCGGEHGWKEDMEEHEEIITEGPVDRSLLRFQEFHHSHAIWKNNGERPLDCKPIVVQRSEARLKKLKPPEELVAQYIRQAGFGGLLDMPFISIDLALVTALLERWRLETHTFHFLTGEWTVTLQDVEVLLGVPVDGEPVVGTILKKKEWNGLCERLLGAVLDQTRKEIKGGKISLTWLRARFKGHLKPGYTDENIRQQARGYILQLIGGILMLDYSGSYVHLCYLTLLDDLSIVRSWGSACLGNLYHYLCHGCKHGSDNVGGPFILLQLWAWERFPYLALKLLGKRFRPPGIWMAKVPLICFPFVRNHIPNRVMRQFGFLRTIPDACDCTQPPHGKDFKSGAKNYSVKYRAQVNMWNNRLHHVVPHGGVDLPDSVAYPNNDPYVLWYNRITIRYYGLIERLRTMDPLHLDVVRNIGDQGVACLGNLEKWLQKRPPIKPVAEQQNGGNYEDQHAELVEPQNVASGTEHGQPDATPVTHTEHTGTGSVQNGSGSLHEGGGIGSCSLLTLLRSAEGYPLTPMLEGSPSSMHVVIHSPVSQTWFDMADLASADTTLVHMPTDKRRKRFDGDHGCPIGRDVT